MLPQNQVLPHTLLAAASERPQTLAMVDVDGRRVTNEELAGIMHRWAASFASRGVAAGHTVLTMMPNCFEAYYAWLGLAWLRAIEVPTNTMYRGSMLAYVLNNSEAEVAVISARYLDRLPAVVPQLEHLKTVIVPDATGDLPDLPFDVVTRESFLTPSPSTAPGAGPDYFDISAMIYTSGTTGPSKGVLVPWAELYEFVTLQPPGSLDPGRGYYSTYPSFHISGKVGLYFSAVRGGVLVLRETFSLSEFLHDIRANDCQATGLLGPLAAMLMRSAPRPDDADTPLESVFMGPIIPEIDEFRRRFGVQVGTGFGMTEVGVPIASDGFNLANIRSCGRRRSGPPGYQVRVVDEHDEPVPPGTVGELVARSEEPWVLNAGYWRMPDKTSEAWRNGWFHTGDAFMEDEDGNFYFVDRVKDAIRRRGENISSFEVEAGVNSHPAVQESAVIAVPSELGEDDVKAVIVLRPDETLEPGELIEWLIPRMPRFMIPRYVELVDALPKTDATFRTQKMKLRENPVSEHTWDRDAAGVVLPPA